MKKLLLSTAIMAIGTIGCSGVASAQNVETFTADHFSQVYQKLSITQAAIGLHTGDFQAISKATTPSPLYTGHGSAAMASIRSLRY